MNSLWWLENEMAISAQTAECSGGKLCFTVSTMHKQQARPLIHIATPAGQIHVATITWSPTYLASFPGLPRLQFLIACSMQKTEPKVHVSEWLVLHVTIA